MNNYKRVLIYLRDRYHPLFHLRKYKLFQHLTRLIDFPIAINIKDIDHKVWVSSTKNLSFVLTGGEAGETKERANFISLVKQGQFKTFFDIGANIGLYGFIFKTISRNSTVTMFEPDHGNVSLILKTIGNSSIKDIKVVEKAVSDTTGELSFFMDDLSGATGTIRDAKVSFNSFHFNTLPQETKVKSISLDFLCKTSDHPDLMKIDVEGAELRVLKGSLNIFEKIKPVVFFECDDNQEAVFSFFTEHGYILFDFENLVRIQKLSHNNLALNTEKHKDIINSINSGLF